MAKTLKDILAGVKSSKKEKLNLADYLKAQGEKDFAASHEVEKHADRVGNDDDVYKGKTKEAKYPKQSDKVYEGTCNKSAKGVNCDVHGMEECSSKKKRLRNLIA
jgi:hypothetical protein